MPKSRAAMLHAIVKLIDEYSAFQRNRPDLPQGNLWGLSQDELEQPVTAFKSQQADEAQLEPGWIVRDVAMGTQSRSRFGGATIH
jgi:hypothetical protein